MLDPVRPAADHGGLAPDLDAHLFPVGKALHRGPSGAEQLGGGVAWCELAGIGPGEGEEVFREVGQLIGLLERAGQALADGDAITGIVGGQLELTAQDGDGGAQLVGGVIDEGPLVGDRSSRSGRAWH